MILCRNFIVPDWPPKVNTRLYRKNRLERAGFSDYIPVFRPSKGIKTHQRYYLSIKIRRQPKAARGGCRGCFTPCRGLGQSPRLAVWRLVQQLRAAQKASTAGARRRKAGRSPARARRARRGEDPAALKIGLRVHAWRGMHTQPTIRACVLPRTAAPRATGGGTPTPWAKAGAVPGLRKCPGAPLPQPRTAQARARSAGRSPGMPLAGASTGGSRRPGWRHQPPERPEAGREGRAPGGTRTTGGQRERPLQMRRTF